MEADETGADILLYCGHRRGRGEPGDSGTGPGAAQGAASAGGISLGILPDPDRSRANPHLTYTIATNMGHARNMIIAHSADALIAVDGSYGTISEAAIALKLGKPVIALKVDWDLSGLRRASNAQEAVDLALAAMKPRL
jgi:uncharacterized protein (TIGR00725 family)